MAAEALPAPGWPMRARLLAADLVAFDASRLGWVLALRAILGLALPLLLGHALNQPHFLWIGLGAYLLTIGDCTDDGDRAQPLRLLTGAALGSLALGTGVLAGGSLATAVAGMLVWGVLTGMMGIYGNAFATMSLPIAWAYVELGLPATDHTMATALLMSGLFAVGGLLALLLALTLRFGGTFAPVRAQTATCYREIARYLDADRPKGFGPPETRVRGAIAEARRRAAQGRQAAAGTSRTNQRALVLIEIADRLYSIAGAMREVSELPDPGCTAALLAIARVLEGRADPATLREIWAELRNQAGAAEGARSDFGSGLFRGRMILELSHALSVAADDELPALPDMPTNSAKRLSALFSPLRANLDLTSAAARHALRFAVVTSAAVIIFRFFPKPFGYWVPLTATVVLKPFTGMTLTRAVQRAIGTVLGILMGLTLMPLLPTVPLQFAAVILLFFAMMLVLPFNYSLAILFLSIGLIPFEHVLTPGIQAAIGSDRLVATAVGALLAVIGGHALWPNYERRTLPDLLGTCTKAMSAYANAVIGTAQGETSAGDMQAERRRAGLALSNFQVGVQRSLTEIGGDDATVAFLRASIALQRLSRTLNALLHAAPAIASSHAAISAFRFAFVPALANPRQSDTRLANLRAAVPAGDRFAEAVFISEALERLISALEMLQAAMASAWP